MGIVVKNKVPRTTNAVGDPVTSSEIFRNYTTSIESTIESMQESIDENLSSMHSIAAIVSSNQELVDKLSATIEEQKRKLESVSIIAAASWISAVIAIFVAVFAQ